MKGATLATHRLLRATSLRWLCLGLEMTQKRKMPQDLVEHITQLRQRFIMRMPVENNMKPYAILAATLLTGCASQPYWIEAPDQKATGAIITMRVPDVQSRCADDHALGCWNVAENTIYITTMQMDAKQMRCIVKHEQRHAAGYVHPKQPQLYTDCGDGSVYPSYNDSWPLKWSVMGMMPR